MPLHPRIAADLEYAAQFPPVEELPLEKARAAISAAYATGVKKDELAEVRDIAIPGPGGDMRIRLYVPKGEGPFPTLIYLHGSGFVLLDIPSFDVICSRLAAEAGCVVASVDYRLAPENIYPAAVDDVLVATEWVISNAARIGGDGERFAISGDSAGACLAAVVTQYRRDRRRRNVGAQLLFYPVTDHYTSATASYEEFGTGYGLTSATMRWFWQQYLGGAKRTSDPVVAPLRARSFAGLPPAFVMTAEFDVLRDEGETYAQRMEEAGVPVELHRSPGLNHGFLRYLGILSESDKQMKMATDWLKARFAEM